MININEFIKILEKEISDINNEINIINIASSLTNVIELITKENILELTSNGLSRLESGLHFQNKLTAEENQFLKFFVECQMI